MKSNCRISVIIGLLVLFGLVQTVCARQSKNEEEECSQPGRIESAKQLIAKNEEFKLKASQFHAKTQASINEAKKLKGQADRLRTLNASVDANAPKEYKANLVAFQQHAALYRSHLEQVEHSLGFCKASQAAYQAQLQANMLHTQAFHMPNIRPPHICHALQVSNLEASHMANSMRVDQQRLVSSEMALRSAEGQLSNAMQDSQRADAQLMQRSQLAEEERRLAGEFASLKTEYELLQTQHNALLGHAASVHSSSVHGKVK